MRIDAHQHVWTLARGDYDWLTPDLAPLYRDFDAHELGPLLDAAEIDATILVQAAPTEAETAFLLSTAARCDRIAGVVGWTDLAAADAPARIAALARAPKLVGLRPMLQDLDDRAWILRPECAPALAAMAAHGLVFDALVDAAQLAQVAEIARRHPDLSIVLDHAGKPAIGAGLNAGWIRDIAAASAHATVSVKLSGLLTQAPAGAGLAVLAPFVDVLLANFGAGRILWGSDWPVLTLAADYSTWTKLTDAMLARCSADDRIAIRGGNAARLYRIGVSA